MCRILKDNSNGSRTLVLQRINGQMDIHWMVVPCERWFELNGIDAAVDANQGMMGYRAVIRNHNGLLMAASGAQVCFIYDLSRRFGLSRSTLLYAVISFEQKKKKVLVVSRPDDAKQLANTTTSAGNLVVLALRKRFLKGEWKMTFT